MKFKKQEFTIRIFATKDYFCKKGKDVKVEGWVSSDNLWGIHKNPDLSIYDITHIPTKRKLFGKTKLKDAKSVICSIEEKSENVDWNFIKVKDFTMVFKNIIREVYENHKN